MSVRNYTDNELTAMIKQNDRAAFDHVYNSYSPLLLRMITKTGIDKDSAHNILEQVFSAAWSNIHSFDLSESPLYIWMHRMAHAEANTFIESITENIHMPALAYT